MALPVRLQESCCCKGVLVLCVRSKCPGIVQCRSMYITSHESLVDVAEAKGIRFLQGSCFRSNPGKLSIISPARVGVGSPILAIEGYRRKC